MSSTLSLGSSCLGFPRMGNRRQLKFALESFWSGASDLKALLSVGAQLRSDHWQLQRTVGATTASHIPSNDFSYYDHMLDLTAILSAVPARYQEVGKASADPLIGYFATYFAMARGYQSKGNIIATSGAANTVDASGVDIAALEMKKWFDTNYHYIVPELTSNQSFALSAEYIKPIAEYREAKALGIRTRPVLVGPLTYIFLSYIDHHSAIHVKEQVFRPVLEALLPVYAQLLVRIQAEGAEWVQIDEPALVLDLPAYAPALYKYAFNELRNQLVSAAGNAQPLKMLLTTYFSDAREHIDLVVSSLPVQGIHVDLVRAPSQLLSLQKSIHSSATTQLQLVSLGIVDGRNIWKSNINAIATNVQPFIQWLATQSSSVKTVLFASSCSLLHSPHSLELENKLDKQWFAFAGEKLHELVVISQIFNSDGSLNVDARVQAIVAANTADIQSRASSPIIHNQSVKDAVNAVTPDMLRRRSPFSERIVEQRAVLHLPPFPTTTIGSFPQTAAVRSWRARLKANKMTEEEYITAVKAETERCIRRQEAIGIDVLVDGEFDRNDMVEFFGTQLNGYVFTGFGWVQSYGSRCVKPPIIYGDITRPGPMTVAITKYAQSITDRPVKGMLTGPITCLQWSFVRDDQPRSVTAYQLALAIRQEVTDLESAGIKVIQIDEPAIREGLPLHSSERASYLEWSVNAFLLSSTSVQNFTQIHTHMCYSHFEDILSAIIKMDTDVITIENARELDLNLLNQFKINHYQNDIGPGLYDIHSPRVPSYNEMYLRLQAIIKCINPESLWINPDCGLKTRGWNEVEAALSHLVEVARNARKEYFPNVITKQ